MRLEYKPGSSNIVADSLSRAPVEDGKPSTVLRVTEETLCSNLVKEQQRQDRDLNDLINYLCVKTLPDDEQAAENVVSMSMKGFGICTS